MVVLNGSSVPSSVWSLPVLRVRPRQQREVVVVCSSRIWLAVHWFSGRSLCCTSDSGHCVGCDLGASRMVGYTVVSWEIEGNLKVGLLELSGACSEAFESLVGEHPLGQRLVVSRSSTKRPLVVEAAGRTLAWLPGYDSEFRILAAVSVLFKLPIPRVRGTAEHWRLFTLEARVAAMAGTVRED